ncbi:hypothetical protein NXV81_25500 [Bacteroides ovatus]|nr:hypothetical protein [Bacteroides ovatus]
MAIIKIGELLKLRGLDINKRIKLVRHKDARQKQFINGVEVEGNPYDWYRNDKDKFIAYQSEQHRDVFKNVDYIVSFIGENGTIARFIGIYKIEGPDNERNTNKYCYKITEVEGFDELKERIIIDWVFQPYLGINGLMIKMIKRLLKLLQDLTIFSPDMKK